MKLLIALIIGLIGLFQLFRKESEERWLWVGHGPDPFKE